MARHVLIVARVDVSSPFRAMLRSRHGGMHGHIAAQEYRRKADAVGTVSYHVAHGLVGDHVWSALATLLEAVTKGRRDLLDWHDRPESVMSEARWVSAYDGADVVAAFRITADGDVTYATASAALANMGLVCSDDENP